MCRLQGAAHGYRCGVRRLLLVLALAAILEVPAGWIATKVPSKRITPQRYLGAASRRPLWKPRAQPRLLVAAENSDGHDTVGGSLLPDIGEEITEVKRELWRLFVEERLWANPASLFGLRGDVIVLGSRLSFLGAVSTLGATIFVKALWLYRLSIGLPPIEEDMAVEISGRFVLLFSGFMWPLGKITLEVVAGLSVLSLLLEDMQANLLNIVGVDLAAQRRRRVFTTALIILCVLLVETPPFPEVQV